MKCKKHLSVTNHGYLGYAVVVNRSSGMACLQTFAQPLNKAMVDSTKVANDVAFRTTRRRLKVRPQGKTTIYTPRWPNASY